MAESELIHATRSDVVSVYTHFSKLLAEQDRLFCKLLEEQDRRFGLQVVAIREGITIANGAASEALRISSETTTRRFDAGNELRGALDDMSRQMARKAELDDAVKAIRFETLARLSALDEGVRTLRENALLAATKMDIRPLEDYRITLQTKADTSVVAEIAKRAALSQGLSIIGAVIGVISFIITIFKLWGG